MSCCVCDYFDNMPGDDGEPNNINKECKGCEQEFCFKCYLVHDCGYHKKEAELCDNCQQPILLKIEIPVYTDDGIFCQPCYKPQDKEAA